MLCQHVRNNMLRSFLHHVDLCCTCCVQFETSQTFFPTYANISFVLRWPMSQLVAFPHEVIVFCNQAYCFETFSLTFPSSLLKLSVLVFVTGSIFKMADNKCKSDTFARFPSSAFIERHNGGTNATTLRFSKAFWVNIKTRLPKVLT